uniref:Conserved domain protein n=1 Tax=Strongyloides papillosus TaxID=174720 RepID=A0A0N5C6Y2_STREA
MSSDDYNYFIKKNEEWKNTNGKLNRLLDNLERKAGYVERDLLDVQTNTIKCESSRNIAGYKKFEQLGRSFNQTSESLQKVKDAMADKIYDKNK